MKQCQNSLILLCNRKSVVQSVGSSGRKIGGDQNAADRSWSCARSSYRSNRQQGNRAAPQQAIGFGSQNPSFETAAAMGPYDNQIRSRARERLADFKIDAPDRGCPSEADIRLLRSGRQLHEFLLRMALQRRGIFGNVKWKII